MTHYQNNIDTKQIQAYQTKLYSLYQVFLGLKMMACCARPSEEFEVRSDHFSILKMETKKLILGRLYILLKDNFQSKNKHNTISFKILIKDVLKNLLNYPDEKLKKLKKLLQRIDDIDDKYKRFRDKMYAHIDLDDNGKLKKIEEFHLCEKDITDLISLAQEAYDELSFLLNNPPSDHAEDLINSLSCKLWDAYAQAGLVRKIRKNSSKA